MKTKTNCFRWISCGILSLFVWVQVNAGYADEVQDRGFALSPVSPLFEGTGVPGYRTNQFTGTATYEIPLKVPAGINGFQPDLTIRYSANNTEGSILGKGWELMLGRIVRSQRKKPVDFTDDDTFVLELGGIRDELVKTGTFGNSILFSTLYKQRNLKIEKFTNYWTVRDGRGMTYRFDVPDQADGAAGVWGWYLGKITESHGNEINIQYVKKDGWQILDKITYSNREIRFITSQTTLNEFWPKFDKLGKSFMRYFLNSIEMYTNGSLHKKYEFNYGNVTGLKNRFLLSVDEVGSDNQKKRIGTMTYEPASTDIRFGAPIPFSDLPQSLGDIFLRIGEVDGDGRPDLMMSGFGDPVHYALNNGNGWSSRIATSVPRPCTTGSCDFGFYQSHVRIADVDGDGLSDIVAEQNGVGPSAGYYVAFGKGNGWEPWQVNTNGTPGRMQDLPTNIAITDVNGDRKDDILHLGAGGPLVNGKFSTLYVNYALSEGRSRWRPVVHKEFTYPDASLFGSFANDTRLMDINADGIGDSVHVRFAKTSTSSGNLSLLQENAYILGSGTGFDPTVYTLLFPSTIDQEIIGVYPNYSWVAEFFSFGQKSLNVIDLNNDGFFDLISNVFDPGRAAYIYRYMLGTDQGFADLRDLNQFGQFGPNLLFSSSSVVFFDFNNDGLIDIVDGQNKQYYPNLTATHFSPGVLKTITDELGKKTTFTVVNSYQSTLSTTPFRFPILKKVEEEDGYSPNRSFTYEYFNPKYDRTEREFQGFGRVRETDTGGRWTDTFYLQDRPRLGFVEKIEKSNGAKITRTYTNNTAIPYDNPLLSETNEENGKIVTRANTYDAYGNVTQEVVSANNGDQFTTLRLFDPNTANWLVSFSHQETVTDKNNSCNEIKFRYDGSLTSPLKGDLTQEVRYWDTENREIKTEYTYDGFGNRLSVKDPNGNITRFKYDSLFNSFPVEVENALGQKEFKTYWESGGGFGQTKIATDLNGVTTQYFYDGFGRLSKVVGPNDQSSVYGSISYQYNVGSPGNNYVETLETEEYGTGQYFYRKESKDGFGQVVQTVQDGEGGKLIYTKSSYDYRGNLIRVSLPGFDAPGPEIENTYDVFDRMTLTVYPGGHRTAFSYNGWQTTVTDANNHSKTITKDSRDRITQVVEPGSFLTRYEYNVLNQLTKITDHLGHIWTYVYDSLGRKTSENDPDLGMHHYQYDDNGNLKERADPMNRLLAFSYDPLNRLTAKDDSTTPGVDFQYFYDEPASTFGIGRRTRMTDPSGDRRFFYDNEGRRVKEMINVAGFSSPFMTQWVYDAMDRAKKIVYPNSREVQITFNDQGLAEMISEFLDNADYTPLGQTKKLSYDSGVAVNHFYQDLDQRLSRIQTAGFMDFNYKYDGVGNVTQMRDDAKGWLKDYLYDDLNRLLSGDGESFAYDALGNITSRNGTAQLYDINKPHALTFDGVAQYIYDDVGNMTSGAGRALFYDAENRPYQITQNGVTTQFVYNGDGDRVLKIVSDGATTRKTVYIGELYEKEITVP